MKECGGPLGQKAQVNKLPSDRRGLRRDTVSTEDKLWMKIANVTGKATVVDINSSGALINCERQNQSWIQVGFLIKSVEVYSNEILIGEYPSAVICHIKSMPDRKIQMGLIFCNVSRSHLESSKKDRLRKRISIQEKFLPSCYCDNPVKYNDIIHFNIGDISATGAKLFTSARNRRQLRGQILHDVTILFPTLGKAKIDCKVSWIRKEAQIDVVSIGVEFIKPTEKFKSILAQYVLTFGIGESKDLLSSVTDAGLKTKRTKKVVTYDFPRTDEDYHKVLALRHDAYSRAGKIDSTIPILDMADQYDNHSHIVIAKHGNQIVGSMRFTYCTNENHSFELDKSIIIPKKFNRSKTLEASRTCVHRDFENTDLVHGLFEAGTQIAAKVGAEWVISSCETKLLKLYKKLGFKTQGIEFTLVTLNRIPHHFIAAPTSVISTSYGLNPLIWHFSYRNVANYLQRIGMVSEVKIKWWKAPLYKLGLLLINSRKKD